LKTGVNSVAGSLINTGVDKIREFLGGGSSSSSNGNGIMNTVTSLVSGGAASALGSVASKAVGGFSSWWCCLSPLAKFGIVGGAIGVGAAIVGGAIYAFSKQRKIIKQLQGQVKALQGQVQTLTATVQQQAETIRQLEQTVAGQAQTIQRLETTITKLEEIIVQQAKVIEQQAQTIANLEDTVEQQKQIIETQAETIANLEQRIADLENRTKSGNDGVEEIPDGDPIGGASVKRGLRDGKPSECRSAITPASCQVYGVQDRALNDSIFFFRNPLDQTVRQIGQTCNGCDIEAMAIHPITNEIYLGSGDNAVGHPNGHLYKLDANTGELRSVGVTRFNDISGLTFDNNGILWGWAKGQGLITLDTETGQGNLELSSSVELADITWNSNYQALYGVIGKELWSYAPTSRDANKLCDNLPHKTEAVKALPANVSPEGLVWISSHNNKKTEIQAYEVATCQPRKGLNLFIGYDDVEGLAMPVAACVQ
jgi:uncharacterized coiled-coil protein SlyX